MIQKTTTISARVPVDVANMIKNSCKQNGMSMSKYLTQIATTPQNNSSFQSGGLVNVDKIELPSEIKPFLSALGGTGVGLLVYKLIKAYMPRDKFEDETIENIALLSAIASGLGSVIAIEKLLEKK
jgi:hypothetical protein